MLGFLYEFFIELPASAIAELIAFMWVLLPFVAGIYLGAAVYEHFCTPPSPMDLERRFQWWPAFLAFLVGAYVTSVAYEALRIALHGSHPH
jgi:hypothetical protein